MSDRQPRSRTRTLTLGRGQSEVLGFAILAALVLSTLGGVSVVTAPALIDAQESEALTLMSDSFSQIDEQLADAQSGQAINVNNVDIPLGVYSPRPTPTNITITETVSGTQTTTVAFNSTPTTFTPTGSDARVVFDMGVIGLVSDKGSVIRATPPTVTSDAASHTGIRFHTTEYINGSTGIQGPAVVQYVVRPPAASGQTMATFDTPDNSRNVTLTVKTEHPSLWRDYAAETTGLSVGSTTDIANDPRSEVVIQVTDGQQLRVTVSEFTLEQVF